MGVNNMLFRRNIVRLFERRKGQLDYRIKQDYVRNGIATIPCRISDYYDVIDPYSVQDYEALNTDFFDYVKRAADVTPAKYPLVLNIIGDCLSQEQKKAVEETIRDDLAYNLGMVERDEKRHTLTFVLMLLGMIISGILLWLTETSVAAEPRELLYLLFWFTGEILCDYLFLTGFELRRERRLAGRLASIKVVFSSSYKAPNYTKSDVDQLYDEIEKDVYKTIEGEES